MSVLSRRVDTLERRRPAVRPLPSPEEAIARIRAMLIEAFGEADFAAAMALDEADATAAEAEGSGRKVSAQPHPRVGSGKTDDTR